MAQFKVSVDLSQMLNAVPIITRQVFPLVNQAVRAIAEQTAANWQKEVYRAKLWSGEKDAYVKSITWAMAGHFAAVVQADYKNADEIETGRPPHDLKTMLSTSPKVRRTKDGLRFMIIPLRANTPGNDALAQSMPTDVYTAASQLKASTIVAQSKRASGEMTSMHPQWSAKPLKKQTPFMSSTATRGTFMVPRNVYKWGGKLDTSGIANLSSADQKRYQGMVRMDNRTPGGKTYSSYLTFRVMSENSPGWIIPARPGLYLAKKTADAMQPLAEKVINEAVAQSLD
ncbi:hypothetical protein [Paraburkholderia rhynchosiae]|uniref:Uncharacterized protein n=1 Tax=Paraburkholderia rhynchosiae TaxID=487049 RepID=A0A2N7WHJ5_9BURK|nr:hypothetical protein [Paraburkholderia rhynchosiae]PMS28887.1 hypothetical protein C0Z16_20885 [Paraburkholderia rhynchosiae]CAB3665575.1 hypothetical protein LMG27174_01863 [Paraburkholderia rhynchosiae]